MRMRFGISPKPASISPDLDDSVLLWTKYRRSGEWEEQIVAMGKTAVDPLCKILQQAKQHGHQETMRRAVRPLGAIGDARAVDSLLAVADLSDQTDSGYINVADDYPVTTAAADALGMIGDERAVPKLLKLLGSEGSTRRTGDVWAACCRALARIGDDRAVSAIGSLLQRQLSTRHQYDVWWEDDAVKALASFGRKSVKPLTAVLKTQPAGLNDTERSRRLTATCVALGDIGDKEAVTALSETLHDRDTGVKIAAINALGKLKDPRAVDALVSMLNDPDRTVREAAANALDALGWKP
jgi:HEAT repeat protein